VIPSIADCCLFHFCEFIPNKWERLKQGRNPGIGLNWWICLSGRLIYQQGVERPVKTEELDAIANVEDNNILIATNSHSFCYSFLLRPHCSAMAPIK